MGALSNTSSNYSPKRTDDYFSLHSPSPLFDYHVPKKPRLFYAPTTTQYVPAPSLSRLSKYPAPGRLSREVHAPCSFSRIGFLSKPKKTRILGDLDNVLVSNYKELRLRTNALELDSLLFVKHEKEVIDLEVDGGGDKDWGELEVLEDGSEVSSVVSEGNCRMLESDGDGLDLEISKLGCKGVESGAAMPMGMADLSKLEDARKLLGFSSLGREEYKELLCAVDRNYSAKLSSLEFEIKSNQAKLQSIRLEKPKKTVELEESGKDLLRAAFVPLTKEEEGEVARALSRSNWRNVLASHQNSNIEITGEILQCLRPGAWLNDEVINVYLELLKERERREPKKFLNCHFFNTFFYKKLIGGRNGYDYKAVRRWTTAKKLGYGLVDCDKIFVPIHKEVHWCLAVINKRDKSLQYLDSLGGRDRHVLRVLARYFMDEMKDKNGQEIDVNSWDQEFVEDLAEQQNGFDCGVFMIKYADFYSRGLGLHFSQENMPYFRLRTAKEILRLRAD